MARLSFWYIGVCCLCYLYTGSEAALQMFSDEVSPCVGATNNLRPWPTDYKAEQAADGMWKSPRVNIAYEWAADYCKTANMLSAQ